eukprot:CAMPEP_0168236568 /NCGR_PEP_ID=MMETSP0140_2-20121125/19655_1 /TAXON_ID=44445 /ORGANISM="Pseudo-nitzschia australis, Strain 10249 10 AB" /LENGTH=60 /DNA_ID=CAMNT_0008170009 /DNA_START=16 /DNA_END=194 /DNA_ORIENTATION=+
MVATKTPAVFSSGEKIERDLVVVIFGADFLANLPGVGSVNLSDGVSVDTIPHQRMVVPPR